ncbi:hypothetical protein ACE6H2_022232 [Prunus campanulata]
MAKVGMVLGILVEKGVFHALLLVWFLTAKQNTDGIAQQKAKIGLLKGPVERHNRPTENPIKAYELQNEPNETAETTKWAHRSPRNDKIDY